MLLTNVSASQVDSFDRCQRYWYNRSILKIPTPQTEAQKRGQDIHSAIENYLRHGTIDPAWVEHVKVAIPHLPQPKSEDVLIEQKISLETFPGGPTWIGYSDLIVMEKLPVKVSDHKSTGNFKYAKTPADLADNTQMNSYGKWVIDNVDFDTVEYEHIYVGTKEIKSKVVSTIVTRDHILKIWDRDIEKVKAMVKVAELEPVTAEVLPPTYSSCGMYGGCPYRDRCNISPLRGINMPDMPTEGSVLMKRLAEQAAARMAANGAAAAPAASAAASPAPAPVAPPAAPASAPAPAPLPGVSVFEHMMKDKPIGHVIYNGGYGYTKLPDNSVMSVKMLPDDYAKAVAAQDAKSAGTVPASSPAPTALLNRLQAAQTGDAAPFMPPTNGTHTVAVVPPDAPSRTSTAEEVNAAVNPPAAEPKRRGRPIGSTNKSDGTLGKFVQLLMGDGGILIGLDEVGQAWVMDLSATKDGWQRLPVPNVG